MIKSYSELIKLKSFEERFNYLKLCGDVGYETFGARRYVNQEFYKSREWKRFRDKIIIRDNGCDLGVEGYEIYGPIIIHHINPITMDDIINRNYCVLDEENAICTQLSTHNPIHYGEENATIITKPIIRTKNDTCPWRQD